MSDRADSPSPTDPCETAYDASGYDASGIQVLRGLDAVRKRPGMYIGDTEDGSGLHQMIFELVDNALAQIGQGGHCDVVLNRDGSVTVSDDGPGLATAITPPGEISFAERVLTEFHAGGRKPCVTSCRWGIGCAVVNALSESMGVRIWHDGHTHAARFQNGHIVSPLTVTGPSAGRTGTEFRFKPSAAIFSHTGFDHALLQNRLRELSFLVPGVEIVLRDARQDRLAEDVMRHPAGLAAYVAWLDRGKRPTIPMPISVTDAGSADIRLDFALWWNEGAEETVRCFTNGLPQPLGGTHLQGLHQALSHAARQRIGLRSGLTAVVAVRMPHPRCAGACRDELASPAVRPVVQAAVAEALALWFQQHG